MEPTMPFSNSAQAQAAALSLRPARPEDVPALRVLFRSVFDESDAGCDLFFSRAFDPALTAVAQWGGEVAGMFYALPALLRTGGGTLPAAYLYALAVAPPLRSRGVGGALARYFEALLPRLGYAAAVLKPAGPELFDYYRRLGFCHTLPARRWEFTAAGLPAPRAARILPTGLHELPGGRARYFSGCDPLFDFGPALLRYAGDYLRAAGGRAVRIETDREEGYALFDQVQGRLRILELGGTNPRLLAGVLCAQTGAAGGTAHLPITAPLGEEYAHGLVKWFGPARDTVRGYLSLTLD